MADARERREYRGPPFIKGVVVLYGPPPKGLKTGVELEDIRLVEVRRVK